jgi:hypothetical protein
VSGRRPPFVPLDVTCPRAAGGCGAAPGVRCQSMVLSGRPYLQRPHAGRVTAARLAEARRSRPRLPAGVSDAWTCPHPRCGRTYWPPAEWEPELWPVVRTQAQLLHSARHRLEDDGRDRQGDH